jgi:glycolate oxidase iron-sulfur subunit
LERKMNNIKNCGADYVVTGNPGCMIQLIYGAKKFQVPVRILHPVSLLNQAYNGKELKV